MSKFRSTHVIRSSNIEEFFLSSRVPKLKFDRFFSNTKRFDFEIDANRWRKRFSEHIILKEKI